MSTVVAAPVVGPPRAGTRLDIEEDRPGVPLPGARTSVAILVVLAAVYFAIGYRTTIDQHVIVFDALERLTRAYLVWHDDPAKLAAVGFALAPVTTLVFLPLAVVKPLATSLVALPAMSAVFAAATVVVLDRTLARCEMRPRLRWPLLAAFAVNPFWVFHAGNGTGAVVCAFFLAASLHCFVSWYLTTEPRFLIGAGLGMSVLVLARYAFIVWAVLFAVLIAVALMRRRADRAEVEGSVVTFAAPVVYALSLWVLFNLLIVGEPFGWLTDNATAVAGGDVSPDGIGRRLLELGVIVFPLAFAAVPALVVAFVVRGDDMALWLSAFVVLGAVILGGHAILAGDEGLLVLRDAMPMCVAAFVGAGWAFRTFAPARALIWGATLGLLVAGLFTAWAGMQRYPFQSLEQAFVRAIRTGDDQEGRLSRGGYRVGIRSEAQMASFINRTVIRRNDILADEARSFGVIGLSGRPQLFLDRVGRGDAHFRRVLDAPYGKVGYLLLTTDARSGDIIQRRYPRAADDAVPGLTVVARTDRYALVRVARARPAAPTTTTTTP